VIPLLASLGVNMFANAAVNKAKQFVACNPDGYVIGDAVLFFLDEDRVSLVGRRLRRTGFSTTPRRVATTSASSATSARR